MGNQRVGFRELREGSQRAPWMLQFLTGHNKKRYGVIAKSVLTEERTCKTFAVSL